MSRKNGHGGQNHCHPPEITYRSQTILGKTAGYAGVFYLREVQFESQNTTSTAFFQSKSSFSNVLSRSTPCFPSVPPRCVFHNPRSGVVLSTKRTYMDLPRSDMQRRALRALVTLCLVFFAGAILVLTSFATPALADENSYNSENIASAGAGSNGSVVVMAPAAAPQPRGGFFQRCRARGCSAIRGSRNPHAGFGRIRGGDYSCSCPQGSPRGSRPSR